MNFNAERVSWHSLQSYFTTVVLQLNKLSPCTKLKCGDLRAPHFSSSKYFVAGHVRYFSGGADLRYGGNISSSSNM